MAEPLKNYFGHDIAECIAAAIEVHFPEFNTEDFLMRCREGFEEMELTARGRHISAAMGEFLPRDRSKALAMVISTLGPELENCDPGDAEPVASADPDNPITGFFYMPHGFFISDFGDDHFEEAMQANYELTKRFTAEFSVRAHLDQNTDRALVVLQQWASDENVHVRRLVSEGTRPRLPWASRLKKFQHDPLPVLELLELLKDDPVEYVRRSVANNLNDIAKDHPDVVVEVAKRWWADGDTNRRRLIRHGLRTLIKAGHLGALDVLGYGPDSPAEVVDTSIEPAEAEIGQKVRLAITIENSSPQACGALVDLVVHFVKANGTTSAKVFKGAELEIDAGGSAVVRKTISVAQHSTRTHYPGVHEVDVLINGTTHRVGSFILV